MKYSKKSLNLKRLVLTQLQALILIFQLLLSPLANAQEQDKEPSELSALFKEATSDTGVRRQILRITEFADGLEAGTLPNLPTSEFDAFHLANQRLEVLESGGTIDVFDLSKLNVELPIVAFTNIEVQFDTKKEELIFNAIRNNETVARHVMSNIPINAIARDKEILSLIDPSGNLHALDMGYVTQQVFKSPIPVFQNLWEAPEELKTLKETEFSASYLTRGLEPPQEELLKNSKGLIPKDAQGEPLLTAGDLIVRVKTKEKERLVGIFPREIITQKIQEGSSVLQWLSLSVSPDGISPELTLEILRNLKERGLLDESENAQEQLNPLSRNALLALEKEQIELLSERLQANEKLSHRNFDTFTWEEWKTSFTRLQEKAKNEEVDLQTSWQELTEPLKAKDPFQKSRLGQLLQKRSLRILGAIAAGTLGAALISHEFPVEAIQTINWIYQNWVPSVLKDASYRIPLLKSMIALVSFWPISVLISKISGPILKKLSEKFSSNPKVSGYFKELYENWGHLSSWQKIVSVGMRFYAQLIYPYWNLVFKKILRQPNFIGTLEGGLNPFTRIKADSQIGKKIGLDRDQFLGINSPLQSKKEASENLRIQSELQSKVLEKNKKHQTLAWILATLAVHEESGIDPATLLSAASGGLPLKQLNQVLNDPELLKDWDLASEKIYKELKSIDVFKEQSELSELDPEEILNFYKLAKTIANQIKSETNHLKTLQWLAQRFKKGAISKARSLLGLGTSDHEFLKKIYANEFVSQQVQQEFTTDHLMVVGIIGLIGERADLSHPENLSADPNGLLWTSGPHLYDLVTNTFAHFFASGASLALVFQGRPQVVETLYEPLENRLYQSKDRQQGFVNGSLEWIKDVVNPLKADLGGIVVKRLSKRLTTIQAGLTLALTFRWAFGGQDPSVALRAWSLFFLAAPWFYGWVWDPIQRGNQMQGERLKEREERLKEARRKISYGLRGVQNETPPEASLKEGYQELFQLYEENNSLALKKLEQAIKKATEVNKLLLQEKDPLHPMDSIPTEKENLYYALLLRLTEALSSKDQKEINKSTSLLKTLLSQKQEVDLHELRKLTAPELLEFSVSNPPVYTRSHGLITWLTTWGGAIGSTILAIPLSVMTFQPDALSNTHIAEWAMISGLAYLGSYLALGKKPWEFYLSRIESLKEKFTKKSCRSLFAPF